MKNSAKTRDEQKEESIPDGNRFGDLRIPITTLHTLVKCCCLWNVVIGYWSPNFFHLNTLFFLCFFIPTFNRNKKALRHTNNSTLTHYEQAYYICTKHMYNIGIRYVGCGTKHVIQSHLDIHNAHPVTSWHTQCSWTDVCRLAHNSYNTVEQCMLVLGCTCIENIHNSITD